MPTVRQTLEGRPNYCGRGVAAPRDESGQLKDKGFGLTGPREDHLTLQNRINRPACVDISPPQTDDGHARPIQEHGDSVAVADDRSSARAGRSSSLALLAIGALTCSTGGATTALAGGRLEVEKIGRSLVAVRTESGTDHSGFPFGGSLLSSPRESGRTAPNLTSADDDSSLRLHRRRCRRKRHRQTTGRHDGPAHQDQANNIEPSHFHSEAHMAHQQGPFS
jgi:hypothetical protein